MTTYNGEKYIVQQIDSILCQTIQDFELIVCDDRSSDATVEILNRYAKKDKRIKVFVNEQNLGFKKNFEKAIQLCSGEYIALSDQDDVWLPNHLEKLLALIGEADIACGDAELINSEGLSKDIFLSQINQLHRIYNNTLLLYRILCTRNVFQGASMLIRRSFLYDTAVLPIPDGVNYHDTWFAACACVLHGIYYTFDVITLYRHHESNITGHKQKRSLLSAAFRMALKIIHREKYVTDRFICIAEFYKRFQLTDTQKKVLDECLQFQKLKAGELGFHEKIRCLRWFWNNYKYIWTRQNNTYRFARTITLLCFNQ